jgi:hypothetical protein
VAEETEETLEVEASEAEMEHAEVEFEAEAGPEAYDEVEPDEYEVVQHDGHEEAYEEEAHYDEEEAEKAEPPKWSLAQRFAARKTKRGGKSGGGSLTSRLRGVVAKSPETRV